MDVSDEVSKRTCKRIVLVIVIPSLMLSILSGLLLYIGIHFENECPMEKYLPIVMIISNSIFLVLINSFALLIINIALSGEPDDPFRTGLKKCCYWSMNCILMIIIFICIICFVICNCFSGAFVRKYQRIRQFDNPTNKVTYCHPIPYYTSMGFFVIWALICLFGLLLHVRDWLKKNPN